MSNHNTTGDNQQKLLWILHVLECLVVFCSQTHTVSADSSCIHYSVYGYNKCSDFLKISVLYISFTVCSYCVIMHFLNMFGRHRLTNLVVFLLLILYGTQVDII